ncbi:rSAM-partnered protein [Halapricum desulfuricans]|mgnify:FL=1|uniref:Putative enzyme of phenylacetate metabolism, PaaB family n=1 Tax=Halapricum desulfuricans TaxID=2841257 RepID=A0A897NYD6_9EURY|nr:rSAM-partnered protein [Halapricum desulfuricans]QSG15599.1 putative enzyme of phenylacetate metabolism, PaaB family [Halapricum desulfuricans]
MPARPTARTTDGRDADGTIPAKEWVVFTRETPTDPAVHTGTVRADDEIDARERAASLFPGVAARWLCPADAIDRDSSTPLEAGEPA